MNIDAMPAALGPFTSAAVLGAAEAIAAALAAARAVTRDDYTLRS